LAARAVARAVRTSSKRPAHERVSDLTRQVVAVHGVYPKTNHVALIVTAARVSRKSLYEVFQCVGQAIEAVVGRAIGNLETTILESGGDLEALLSWAEENGDDAVLALIHSPAVDLDRWERLAGAGATSVSEELELGATLHLLRSWALARFDRASAYRSPTSA